MSVLKKKISLQANKDTRPKQLSAIWQDMFASLQPTLESLMSQVTWSLAPSGEGIELMDMPQLMKAHKAKALYFGFGETANRLSCIVIIEPKLAGLIRKCSFNEHVEDFSNISLKEPTRLDFLLPGALVDLVTAAINKIGEKHCNQDLSPKFHISEKSTELESFSLASNVDSWLKMSASFQAELSRKVKPEQFSFDIILPYADIAPSLTLVSDASVSNSVRVDLSNCKAELKHQLERTLMPVRAVLEDIQLTVADCTRLHVGQVLPLPGVSVSRLRLEAGIDEKRAYLAPAQLGVFKTHRAVRLNKDVAKSFVDTFVADKV